MVMVKKVSGFELRSVLLDSKRINGIDYAIVDVRDEDFSYGNIQGCKNIPSSEFNNIEKVHELIKDVPTLYFHCMLSQVRGPKCAQRYSNFLNSQGIHQKQIFVLEGGYQEFANKFGTEKDLVVINKPADYF